MSRFSRGSRQPLNGGQRTGAHWSATALATGSPAGPSQDHRHRWPGGSGKTTLAALLQRVIPKTGVLHTDDLAWNEPLFQWDHVLIDALEQLHATGALTLTPPAWRAHGREGHIVIPPGTTTVLVEGTGAGMRAATPLLDAHLWVQTADDVAQERGLRRDIAEGVNGDAVKSVRFWHHWMATERAFFAEDRPWERADVILRGVTLPGLGTGEVAWIGPSHHGFDTGHSFVAARLNQLRKKQSRGQRVSTLP